MKRTPFAELAQYMDLLLDAICAVDKDNRLTYVSPGAKNVFGYEPEEMKGRLIFDFVHPDDLEKTKESAYAVNRGEQLLREVGRRISSAIRATDTAARIGGDEFTVLVDAVPSNDNSAVTAVAGKILAALQPPLILPHGQEKVTASIGIALWPQHGSNIESLLNFADEAMYSAKRAGGNQYWL